MIGEWVALPVWAGGRRNNARRRASTTGSSIRPPSACCRCATRFSACRETPTGRTMTFAWPGNGACRSYHRLEDVPGILDRTPLAQPLGRRCSPRVARASQRFRRCAAHRPATPGRPAAGMLLSRRSTLARKVVCSIGTVISSGQSNGTKTTTSSVASALPMPAEQAPLRQPLEPLVRADHVQIGKEVERAPIEDHVIAGYPFENQRAALSELLLEIGGGRSIGEWHAILGQQPVGLRNALIMLIGPTRNRRSASSCRNRACPLPRCASTLSPDVQHKASRP